MSRRILTVIIGLLAMMLALGALAGCSQSSGEDTSEETPEESTNDETDLQIELVTQWTESGHAQVVAFAAAEADCVMCHDGGGFADQVTDPAELGRDWVVATDCRACHTGYGPEVASAGVVDIPTMSGYEAGVGALCASCHNGRRVPDPASERRSAPHHSVQADVLTGTGGMPLEGVTYLVNERHATIEDSCLGCHLATSDSGLPDHTFGPDFDSCQAADCHAAPLSASVEANADYDGDGSVESFTDEVTGLMDMLDGAINDALDGGSYEAAGGAIVFTSAAGDTFDPGDEVYSATFNYLLMDYDGSMGFHNPAFAVSLLQDTYSQLSGQASPGATIETNTSE